MYDSHYRIDCGRSAGFNIGNGRWTSYAWVRLQRGTLKKCVNSQGGVPSH